MCIISCFGKGVGSITFYNQKPLYNQKKKKSAATTAEMAKLPQGLDHKSWMFHSKLVKNK